jgi:hypothetical protein
MRIPSRKTLTLKVSLLILVFLASTIPSWAILGVRRRTARRTAAVVHSQDAAAAKQQQQTASAQQQPATAQQQPAAAQQQTGAAQQQAAAAATAPKKTTQQQLEELQSLYKQGLITESDYDEQKKKILDEME